jgi:phosphate starvation-inducible PhoH-like protein
VRPVVEAGESLGFLPGDFREKVNPYLQPLLDSLSDFFPKEQLQKFMDNETIEIVPLAYMRGRTLNNAFIILDEAQNSTRAQMKMFLTRLGRSSKIVINGDDSQIDLPKKSQSGLVEIQHVIKHIDDISFVYFDKSDVVRHALVQKIIEAYDMYQENND